MAGFKDSIKSLRGLFWESDESTESTASSPAPSLPSVAAAVDQPLGPADEKIRDRLLKAIQAANLDGFDYLEFKDAVRDLAADVPDESLRFRAAFKTAKTVGVTLGTLVSSAQHYLGALAAEEKSFQSAQGDRLAKEVQAREKRSGQLDADVLDKENRIKVLNDEIRKAVEEKQGLVNQIAEARAKIESTQIAFDSTYRALAAAIESDIQKLKSYLKE